MEKHECLYNPFVYNRDDSGFFLNCVKCGQTRFFEVNTEDELLNLFGLMEDEGEKE